MASDRENPERPDLDPLFAPESVAVVGASPDSWYSSQLMDNLLDYGYDGTVYPVNPSRDEAWDRTCYDTIADVPEVVDLAVVSVPREYVVDVVTAAGEMGVPAALVITAGFAEADDEGARLQAELAEAAAEHDIRVCGPNCIGLANAREGTVLTSTCSRKPEPGNVGLVSHSGALAFTTFFERAADEDLAFSHIVSTGNEADLTLTDYVEYMAADPAVDVICAYVEGLDRPRRFMGAAEAAVRGGTPVLAVKIGGSAAAESAAMSHTGSLVGTDEAWDAVCDRVGVQQVPDIPDLLGRASAHAAFDPPSSNRVCVASTSGGLASLLADMASERGLDVPPLEGETERRLLDMEGLLTFGELHNPVDIRGYGADHLPEIADALFADDAYDAYVFAVGLSAVDERADDIADDLLAVADAADDPVLFLWTGRKDPDELGDLQPYERVREQVPLFYDPGRCMDALASLVEFGANRDRLADRPARSYQRPESDQRELDVPTDRTLTWGESADLLSAFDVETVETRLAEGPDEAATVASDLGFPVVLKVDSADVPHRSTVGGVRTDVRTAADARDAYEEILSSVREAVPDAEIEGVLIQPQVEDGVEALTGVSTDPEFGPLVAVGPGGTLVEQFDERALLVPPFTAAEAADAIAETRLDALLVQSDADATALAELLSRVGDLAAECGSLDELDLNPVLVRESGVEVVDALVRTR
ncbi:acetate--CoA ligase family protein (plasmid) [Halorussus limi]|uniref:acetate--CoA ligase (ADP-forming) n=1 Tax=Halorussus limi TaxID=2938695 RepID=A0A8U0I059_9EURY|nr:acetate--CoA ligase family protein [Halorussus limi]UPV76755.1 acetate--CoA ligase family protein [Halorussus limi]